MALARLKQTSWSKYFKEQFVVMPYFLTLANRSPVDILRDPFTQMEEEKAKHAQKMKKQETDMENVIVRTAIYIPIKTDAFFQNSHIIHNYFCYYIISVISGIPAES